MVLVGEIELNGSGDIYYGEKVFERSINFFIIERFDLDRGCLG